MGPNTRMKRLFCINCASETIQKYSIPPRRVFFWGFELSLTNDTLVDTQYLFTLSCGTISWLSHATFRRDNYRIGISIKLSKEYNLA
jgi:hypothetical protein